MYKIIVLIICILIIAGNSELSAVEKYEVLVLRVSDGDTVLVSGDLLPENKYVRLFGIDCPEVQHGRKFKGGQPYGNEATIYLNKLIMDKTVEITVVGTDMYGRLLGEVWYENKNINTELVRQGLAYAFAIRGETPPSYNIRAEDKAKKEQLGLWSLKNRVRPKLYRKYWSLRKLISDYRKDEKIIKWVKWKRIAVFEFETEDENAEILKTIKKLGDSGIKYIPVPILFTEDGKRKMAYELLEKPFKKFPYKVSELPGGKYAGIIGKIPPDENSLHEFIKESGKEKTGTCYMLNWVSSYTLKRNEMPEEETLYEILCKIKTDN